MDLSSNIDLIPLNSYGFACGIRWLAMLENRKVISFLKTQPKAQDMTLWELLEFGRVCILSEDNPLEEAGIRSSLSVGDFPEISILQKLT